MSDEKTLIDKSMKDINTVLKGVNVKNVSVKDMTIRIGNKILKYELVSNEEYPLDKEIREEYGKLINEKLKTIRDTINSKFNETLKILQSTKDEFLRKEQSLLDQLKKAVPMPEVNMGHARRGLSIVKGDRTGEVYWLVRRTYAPKTITTSDGHNYINQIIKPAVAEKLVTEVYIMITTMNNNITAVSTRKINGLELFQHYHQANPDCWGNWKYQRNWKTPDDIIKVADEAEAVLSNVNMNSIARHDPTGMPSTETLKNSVVLEKKKLSLDDVQFDMPQSRTGRATAEDVWTID